MTQSGSVQELGMGGLAVADKEVLAGLAVGFTDGGVACGLE
jgi:hypothetical protein